MYPNMNYGIHAGKWVNPLASTYVQPIAQHLEELSQKYPSVSSWLRSGRCTYLDRSITFLVPAGQTVIQAFNVSAGYDCLVFQRKATVVNTSAPTGATPTYTVVPNAQSGYVEIVVARKDAAVDTEQASVSNNFGFGWAPNRRPQVPEYWSGSDVREFTLVNNGQDDVKVVLTLTLVLL
jgi:hypothetical protein